MSDRLFRVQFDDKGRITARIHNSLVEKIRAGQGEPDEDFLVFDLGMPAPAAVLGEDPPPPDEGCKTVVSVGVERPTGGSGTGGTNVPPLGEGEVPPPDDGCPPVGEGEVPPTHEGC